MSIAEHQELLKTNQLDKLLHILSLATDHFGRLDCATITRLISDQTLDKEFVEPAVVAYTHKYKQIIKKNKPRSFKNLAPILEELGDPSSDLIKEVCANTQERLINSETHFTVYLYRKTEFAIAINSKKQTQASAITLFKALGAKEIPNGDKPSTYILKYNRAPHFMYGIQLAKLHETTHITDAAKSTLTERYIEHTENIREELPKQLAALSNSVDIKGDCFTVRFGPLTTALIANAFIPIAEEHDFSQKYYVIHKSNKLALSLLSELLSTNAAFVWTHRAKELFNAKDTYNDLQYLYFKGYKAIGKYIALSCKKDESGNQYISTQVALKLKSKEIPLWLKERFGDSVTYNHDTLSYTVPLSEQKHLTLIQELSTLFNLPIVTEDEFLAPDIISRSNEILTKVKAIALGKVTYLGYRRFSYGPSNNLKTIRILGSEKLDELRKLCIKKKYQADAETEALLNSLSNEGVAKVESMEKRQITLSFFENAVTTMIERIFVPMEYSLHKNEITIRVIAPSTIENIHNMANEPYLLGNNCSKKVLDYAASIKADLDQELAPSYAIHGTAHAPAMLHTAKLKPIQRACLEFGQTRKRILLGDEQGIGKSWEDLALTSNHDAYPCLIIGPKDAVGVWQREIPKNLPARSVKTISDTLERFEPSELETYDFTLIHFDVLSDHVETLAKTRWKKISGDECHNFNNDKTIVYQNVEKIVNTSNPEYITLMTGGAAENGRPIELLPLIRILGVTKHFGSEERFKNTFCGGSKENFLGTHNTSLLNYIMRKHFYIRRRKRDAADQFPPYEHEYIACPIDNQKEYDTIVHDFHDSIISAAFDQVSSSPYFVGADTKYKRIQVYQAAIKQWNRLSKPSFLAHAGKVRLALSKGKLQSLLRIVDLLMRNRKKLVVYAHHRELQKSLHKTLSKKYKTDAIFGGASVKKRVQVEDDFQNTDLEIVVLSMKGAKQAMSLTASDAILLCESDWMFAEQQSMRIDRITTEHEKLYLYSARAYGTYDDYFFELSNKKLNNKAQIQGDSDRVNSENILIEHLQQNLLERVKALPDSRFTN